MKYGSTIIIQNIEGKILLQHRDNNAPTDKNLWALWGGGQEGSETPIETAIRELKEELGIEVQGLDLKFYKKYKVNYINKNGEEVDKEVTVFVLMDNGNYKFQLHEGDDMKYFSVDEIKDLPFAKVPKSWLWEYLGL